MLIFEDICICITGKKNIIISNVYIERIERKIIFKINNIQGGSSRNLGKWITGPLLPPPLFYWQIADKRGGAKRGVVIRFPGKKDPPQDPRKNTWYLSISMINFSD